MDSRGRQFKRLPPARNPRYNSGMYTRILALAAFVMAATAAHAQQDLGVSTDALSFRRGPKITDTAADKQGTLAFETDLAKRIVAHARKECEDKKPKNATPFNVNTYRRCVMDSVNLSRTRLKDLLKGKRVFSNRYSIK